MRIKWFSIVRMTGLLLVLLYHFFKNTFTGGFIGVDIFFTFSGYLITALFIDEYAKHKKIDLLNFYRRRFYRIVPPLVLMVLIVMPFTFLVREDYIVGIGHQIASTLGFTTNWYESLTGGNYESQFIPHLFVHTWSLAIEMQFYIVWGLIIYFLGKKKVEANRFRSSIFMIATLLFFTGFLSMFIRALLSDNVSMIYFSTLSHSFPFFLGAMYATMTGVQETTIRFKKNVRLWTKRKSIGLMALSFALLVLLTFILEFSHFMTYLFGFSLASLFACLMIYGARLLSDQTPNVKEPTIVTFLADISYGVYLFHWPLYIIFGQLTNNWLAVILTVIFSVLFSSLSYYILEPFIAGKKVNLFSFEIDMTLYSKWIYGLTTLLALVAISRVVLAPKMGDFETSLLTETLQQEQTKMNRTHTLTAGDATALSDVNIIGDSVALRSQSAFSSIIPEAQLDAEVSRNFDGAFEIFKNQISSGTLSQTTVLAIGVNSLDNYQADIQQFLDTMPDGYRLIIVTPYDANNINQVKTVRDYELTLPDSYSYVTIADWYGVAVDNPEIWNGTDGVHYSDSDDTGENLYVGTIQEAIEASAKKPAKGEENTQ